MCKLTSLRRQQPRSRMRRCWFETAAGKHQDFQRKTASKLDQFVGLPTPAISCSTVTPHNILCGNFREAWPSKPAFLMFLGSDQLPFCPQTGCPCQCVDPIDSCGNYFASRLHTLFGLGCAIGSRGEHLRLYLIPFVRRSLEKDTTWL